MSVESLNVDIAFFHSKCDDHLPFNHNNKLIMLRALFARTFSTSSTVFRKEPVHLRPGQLPADDAMKFAEKILMSPQFFDQPELNQKAKKEVSFFNRFDGYQCTNFSERLLRNLEDILLILVQVKYKVSFILLANLD